MTNVEGVEGEEPTKPEEMLGLARALAAKVRFAESLHWYRTYLCQFSEGAEIRSEMHRVHKTERDFEAAKQTVQLAGEVSSSFVLDDPQVREGLLELARLTTSGPADQAIGAAERLQVNLHTALRAQLDLGENEEAWAEAASWSAETENYQLALRLAEKSTQAPRLQPLYLLLCQAERCLEYFCLEESSLKKIENAQSLKLAMQMRDIFEIRRCLALFMNDDSGDGGNSPGSGVPVRPRPPNLPANEKRDWPHSPPPA